MCNTSCATTNSIPQQAPHLCARRSLANSNNNLDLLKNLDSSADDITTSPSKGDRNRGRSWRARVSQGHQNWVPLSCARRSMTDVHPAAVDSPAGRLAPQMGCPGVSPPHITRGSYIETANRPAHLFEMPQMGCEIGPPPQMGYSYGHGFGAFFEQSTAAHNQMPKCERVYRMAL